MWEETGPGGSPEPAQAGGGANHEVPTGSSPCLPPELWPELREMMV